MFKKIIPITALAALLFLPLTALAADTADKPRKGVEELRNNLGQFGGDTGLGDENSDLKGTIASIINVVLGLLGIIAVIMILTAGYRWMMAGGNEQTVTDAKNQIKNAVIGLAVVFMAWGIASFTINQLSDATGAGGGGSVENNSESD